jgi:hypothetical protein
LFASELDSDPQLEPVDPANRHALHLYTAATFDIEEGQRSNACPD